ncbi:MAG TPA: hypothetical protein VM555_11835, partial [Tahibacter sp.]|nr:hypothetical protein [Tahibacter sp.]
LRVRVHAMLGEAGAVAVDGEATENFLALAVHVPRESRRRFALRRSLLRAGEPSVHPKLAWLLERYAGGAEAFDAMQRHTEALETDLLHGVFSPYDTAASLLYQHPSLVNLSTKGAPDVILRECIGDALRRRSRMIDEIDDLGEAWSRRVPLLDDGKVVKDEQGNTVFTIEVHADVRRLMGEPMALALKYSQQKEELHGQTWRMNYGSTVDERRVSKSAAGKPVLRAGQTRWTHKALTRMNGIATGAVSFEAPRPGGWTIREIWSADDALPMNAAVVAALTEGRLFARVDAEGKEGAWVGTFAAQQPRPEAFTTFTAKHQSNKSGADYAEVIVTLDPLLTDLEVNVKVTTKSSADALAGMRLFMVEPNGVKRDLWGAQPSTKGSYGNLRVDVVNEWLRHLACYAEFYDAADQRMVPPGWTSKMPLDVGKTFDVHSSRKYIDLLGPIDTVFGIPLGPKTTTLEIPVPDNAASVKLYWGGLGTGEYDDSVCAIGATCTVVLEMAVPILLLVMGASEKDTGFLNNLMKDPKVRYGLYALGASLVISGSGTYIGLAQDPGRAAGAVALKLVPALSKFGLKKLAQYFARKGAEGVLRKATPLVNLAFLAFDTAVTLMQLGQTTAAVVQSPFYYATKLVRTFDLHGHVLPDPSFNRFPDHHDRMVVRVLYDTGNALPLQEQALPSTTLSEPLPFRFDDIAAGGRIRVFVFFYAANGWQSAMGASAWIDAKGRNGTSVLDMTVTVKNQLIPLSRTSVYQHREALSIENGRHVWKARGAPTATVTSPPPDDRHAIVALSGITLAQRPGMLAYAWKAKGLNLPRDYPGPRVNDEMYAMQNLSMLQDPESACAISPVGFALQCGVAYDIGASDDGSGANFYLDPSAGTFDAATNLGGGHHLRRIALSLGGRPRFEPGSNESWGRFPRAVDSFVVHPQGYVAGVSAHQSKLYILQLQAVAKANEKSTMASLYSGEGSRVGLLDRPVAIAVALDGRLLVLEEGNRRIQCFDISGNPVPYFKQAGSSEKSAVLPLRATSAPITAYLDLSVEGKGYLFVLACDENGSKPEHYRVDIYEPDGTFLVSTPRVAAARIAVDLARGLYTLNWETLIGADNRTEPSVSHWLPPPPPALMTRRKR